MSLYYNATSRGRDSRAAVVGAGVSGLTSALLLAEAGWTVRVVARERTPNTTSDVAAAVWLPFRVGPTDRVHAWAARSYEVFVDLAESAPESGVTLIDGIEVQGGRGDPDRPDWADIVDGFRSARADELPNGYHRGVVGRFPVIQMPRYMRWLQDRLTTAGGAIATGEVASLDDIVTDSATDLVVNCTGLGARDLVGDDTLVPVRGQIVRVSPGYGTRFVQAAEGPHAFAYIIPRPDCTVMGGTAEEGSWDTTPQPEATQAIQERCLALEPRLGEAKVLSVDVGLRPYRPAVRLELAAASWPMTDGPGSKPSSRDGQRRPPVPAGRQRAPGAPGPRIIHNYGHGGAGVTLSWGCAQEVVQLAER